jgi:hypothetical protein
VDNITRGEDVWEQYYDHGYVEGRQLAIADLVLGVPRTDEALHALAAQVTFSSGFAEGYVDGYRITFLNAENT